MVINLYLAEPLKPFTERNGRRLTIEMGDDHAADIESALAEHIAQAQHVFVVSDAQVAAHLVALDILGTDYDDNLGIVLELHQHAKLAVRMEPRQHAAGMIIVVEFSAKLEIEFVAELCNSFLDVLRLDAEILVVVKT